MKGKKATPRVLAARMLAVLLALATIISIAGPALALSWDGTGVSSNQCRGLPLERELVSWLHNNAQQKRFARVYLR